MSVTVALAFIYICCEADTRTGIWKGSAKSLSGELGIPERTARDVLEKMEHGDYIRRFAVPGRHSCYPILVHKFLITDGEHSGEQLNAIDSKSPADLAYFSREHSVEENGEHGVEHGAAQKRIEKENRERRKKQDAATAPAAQPVAFRSDLLTISTAQDARLADTYPWVDRRQEYRKMDLWLAANRPSRKVRNTLAFCQNWFNKIPCPATRRNDGSKKPTVGDNMRATLEAFRSKEQDRPN
jgi:hypothetical protein